VARAPGEARTRYVAFRVEAREELPRKTLIRLVQDAGRATHGAAFENETGAWLTRYNGTRGILRCKHSARDAIVAALEAVRTAPDGTLLRLVPFATSGTLRSLIDKHVPELREARDTSSGRRAPPKESRPRG
jgi:RNase P/RNase MRP subunit POP5